ncbi:MAG: septal ring lytic transglycosylase RlpA family protein [Hyphomicrobium sp.]
MEDIVVSCKELVGARRTLSSTVPSTAVRSNTVPVLRQNRQDSMKSLIRYPGRSAADAVIAFTVSALMLIALPAISSAKTPGATYCFNGICHRVQTIAEVQTLIGHDEIVGASFFDECKADGLHPCATAISNAGVSAELPGSAASPVYPNGTLLGLFNPKTNAKAVVRITSAGPYIKGRLLDVSRGTAAQLGFIDAGTAQLNVTVLPASD